MQFQVLALPTGESWVAGLWLAGCVAAHLVGVSSPARGQAAAGPEGCQGQPSFHHIAALSLCLQVICAGCLDTFQICIWSVRTGRLLDILAGHEGPVCSLAFTPAQSLLASASWDKTVRTWDVFRYGLLPTLIRLALRT